MITISVAIPCYRSAETIGPVVDELRSVITARPGYDYQIILVNDYPEDGTFDVITRLCHADKRIVGVNLSRNFGQSTAKMAAIPYVTGDVLVFMDDDGQHPADQIFRLVDKVLTELGTVRDRAVYIGDSEVDIATARNAGLDEVIVSWGFRDPDFLREQGAKLVVDDAETLYRVLTA